jgi:hypothetical protein
MTVAVQGQNLRFALVVHIDDSGRTFRGASFFRELKMNVLPNLENSGKWLQFGCK